MLQKMSALRRAEPSSNRYSAGVFRNGEAHHCFFVLPRPLVGGSGLRAILRRFAHNRKLGKFALHLRAYADNPHCTVVLMGDMNVDRDRDQGTEDATSLEAMLASTPPALVRGDTVGDRCAKDRDAQRRRCQARTSTTSSSRTRRPRRSTTSRWTETRGWERGHGDERGLDHSTYSWSTSTSARC